MGQSEAELEKSIIELLEQMGWTYRSDLKNEKDLWNNLREKINYKNHKELKNVPITDKEWADIVSQIKSRTKTPYEASKWLRGEQGVVNVNVDREDTSKGSIKLEVYRAQRVSGGTASYEVVHQITSTSVANCKRRFDVTLLISGLPVLQLELKTAEAKDGFLQAFYQVKGYAKDGVFSNGIFNTLQLFVISNAQRTRYFANVDHYKMHKKGLITWRTPSNARVEDIYNFTKEFLGTSNLQQVLSEFMVLSEDGNDRVTMVLRPYQIHAIRRIYQSVADHESGFVWHATGSGKTLTCFVATKLLSRRTGVHRTIMLVDRRDLDQQTLSEFTKFAPEYNTGVNTMNNTLVVGTDDTTDLENALLNDSNKNAIIITTRQKLSTAIDNAKKEANESEDTRTKFDKLLKSHIVFIVDECHRAISGVEQNEVKEYFPQSTWIGFTGTPIFEENKKAEVGQSPRTTQDQYGPCLHSYTIKNALEDGAVLAFQVEHEWTIKPKDVDNVIIKGLEKKGKTREDAIKEVRRMKTIEKEALIPPSLYEKDEHIQAVIKKILDPNAAFIRFAFSEGKPTMSAILATNSIEMAKKYYDAFKKYKKELQAQGEEENPLLDGRVMNDPDFPRIAVTYSSFVDKEKTEKTADVNAKLEEIIEDYNSCYGTNWHVSSINQYNTEINKRLARKSGRYQDFGNHLDLVIVVQRLLTGFDAPTIQTLFVDKTLTYAPLIQAFSRTNRTYQRKDGWVKEKGFIVSFRQPEIMKQNVEDATRLYTQGELDVDLIYPSYEESKKKFFEALEAFKELPCANDPTLINEHSSQVEILEYVRAYQRLAHCHRALSTYDEYAKDMNESIREVRNTMNGENTSEYVDVDEIAQQLTESEQEKCFVLQMNILDKHRGTYESLKGYIEKKPPETKEFNFKDINFYDDFEAQTYDVDTAYINKLLERYPLDTERYRVAITKELKRANKPDFIRDMYIEILDEVDKKDLHGMDVVYAKDDYFKSAIDAAITAFSKDWMVGKDLLEESWREFAFSDMEEPNTKLLGKSANIDELMKVRPEFGTQKYKVIVNLKRKWVSLLKDRIIPMQRELR